MKLSLKHDLIFLDCEMTGPDPDKHQIYEISALRVNKQNLDITDEFISFCGPTEGSNIDAVLDNASNFCLSNYLFVKNLEQIKLSSSPQLVLKRFLSWLPERYYLVGFNLYLDLEFINKVLRDAGLKHRMWYQYIDLNTVMELYLVKNNIKEIASQYDFAELLGIDANYSELHGANFDAKLSYKIFRKCLSKNIF